MIKNHANTTVIEEICTGCGMPKTSWKGNNGRGYWKGEEIYCCLDCAEDIECNVIYNVFTASASQLVTV